MVSARDVRPRNGEDADVGLLSNVLLRRSNGCFCRELFVCGDLRDDEGFREEGDGFEDDRVFERDSEELDDSSFVEEESLTLVFAPNEDEDATRFAFEVVFTSVEAEFAECFDSGLLSTILEAPESEAEEVALSSDEDAEDVALSEDEVAEEVVCDGGEEVERRSALVDEETGDEEVGETVERAGMAENRALLQNYKYGKRLEHMISNKNNQVGDESAEEVACDGEEVERRSAEESDGRRQRGRRNNCESRWN